MSRLVFLMIELAHRFDDTCTEICTLIFASSSAKNSEYVLGCIFSSIPWFGKDFRGRMAQDKYALQKAMNEHAIAATPGERRLFPNSSDLPPISPLHLSKIVRASLAMLPSCICSQLPKVSQLRVSWSFAGRSNSSFQQRSSRAPPGL